MIDQSWLAAAATDQECLELTAELVRYRSYPGEEGAVQRAVAAWLDRHGLQPQLSETAPDRPNVIARVENGPGPTLLLNGHVDTVLAAEGWESDPWEGRREGDRYYGLGAFDMKSGVAAAMLVTRALAERRDLWSGTLIFTSVVDEEAYSIGARALVDSRIQADYCIVTEPSWDTPILGGVGKVLVCGEVTGRAAHGSWPFEGINAAVEAARLVALLDSMPLGKHPSLTATQCLLSLQSGSAQYVITVPEKARFVINRHIVPGETGESVLAEMRALAEGLSSPARFDFSIDQPYYPPWETDPQLPMVAQFAAAYQAEAGHAPQFGTMIGVADSNYFSADLGIPTIQFGPSGGGAHQCNEWVHIPSIGASVRVILRLATDLLSR
jgi:acetylornithine deacetylase/succinyl-diaminopimelate desuccinylase-like protein